MQIGIDTGLPIHKVLEVVESRLNERYSYFQGLDEVSDPGASSELGKIQQAALIFDLVKEKCTTCGSL